MVLINFPNREVAREIAGRLVEARLAACVNLIPGVESIYRWEGNIECEEEVTAVVKTTEGAYSALEKKVQEWHPYECPEILKLPVSAGARPPVKRLRSGERWNILVYNSLDQLISNSVVVFSNSARLKHRVKPLHGAVGIRVTGVAVGLNAIGELVRVILVIDLHRWAVDLLNHTRDLSPRSVVLCRRDTGPGGADEGRSGDGLVSSIA